MVASGQTSYQKLPKLWREDLVPCHFKSGILKSLPFLPLPLAMSLWSSVGVTIDCQ